MDTVNRDLVINYQVADDCIRNLLRVSDADAPARLRVTLHFDYIALLPLKLSGNLIKRIFRLCIQGNLARPEMNLGLGQRRVLVEV